MDFMPMNEELPEEPTPPEENSEEPPVEPEPESVEEEPYVTLEEAEEIIDRYFMSESAARGFWDGLEELDKRVCLRNAFRSIELLPFIGKQMLPDQGTQFPRWPFEEIPQAVKEAQVLVAVDFADPAAVKEMERYRRMRAAGVSAYRIGKFSETLKAAESAGQGLINSEALNLLRPWFEGGYRIV